MEKYIIRIALSILRLIYRTVRIVPVNMTIPENGIIAAWHDEMLGVFRFFSDSHAMAMVSQSDDGSLAEQFLQKWKYRFIRGSQHRGGKEGLSQIAQLSNDNIIILTVDGSKGPRHRMKPGAVIASHRSGAPLYLCRVNGRGFRLKKSWDRLLICYPFTRMEITISGPIFISAEANKEQLTKSIIEYGEQLESLLPEENLFTPL